MFAHQVIEDIRKGGIFDEEGIIERSSTVIMNAQKFHLGEYHSIRNLFKNDEGKEVFSERKYLFPPYKTVWIDCFHDRSPEYDYSLQDLSFTFCSKYAVLLDVSQNGTWHVFGFFYFEHYRHWQMMPMIQHISFSDSLHVIPKLLKINGFNPTDKDNESLCDSAIHILMLLYCGIRLLNCKNIQTEKIKAPEALNKKRRKNGKQEIFDYHVLNVVVPGKKRGYSPETKPLSHNRVHLCRGHFKEYTSEHPLFGHHTGLYWWQPHVRGQNKSGIVVKDYNVKTA